MKAGVRFVSYDHFKHMLADAEVSVRSVLYGTAHETDVCLWVRAKSPHLGVYWPDSGRE